MKIVLSYTLHVLPSLAHVRRRLREELRRMGRQTGENSLPVREGVRLPFTDGGGDSLLELRGRNDVTGLFDVLKESHG